MRKQCKRKVWSLINPIRHAIDGPIRHAAQDATHMIEVAERALTMTLQDLRAAKAAP